MIVKSAANCVLCSNFRGILSYRTCKDRDLILKGIPVQLRAELWMFYSGAINEV